LETSEPFAMDGEPERKAQIRRNQNHFTRKAGEGVDRETARWYHFLLPLDVRARWPAKEFFDSCIAQK
jgi:hypothetical protein